MWLKAHLPAPVWNNRFTISILLALAVLAYGFYAVHQASVEASAAAARARSVAAENTRLGRENRRRINEIQLSRVVSCRRTYQAFIDLLKPSIPRLQTSDEKARSDSFFNRVEKKKAQCATQVAAKVKKPAKTP